MLIHKIFKIVAIIIGVVATFLVFRLFFYDNEEVAMAQDVLVNPTYALVFISLLLTTVVAIIGAIVKFILNANKKQVINLGIFLGTFVIIYIVSTAISSDTPVKFIGSDPSSRFDSKLAGIGLYMFYIMFALCIVTLVLTSIAKLFRR